MKKNSRPLKQDRMRREDRSAESKTPKQLQGRRHRQDMIAMTCLDDPKELETIGGACPETRRRRQCHLPMAIPSSQEEPRRAAHLGGPGSQLGDREFRS